MPLHPPPPRARALIRSVPHPSASPAARAAPSIARGSARMPSDALMPPAAVRPPPRSLAHGAPTPTRINTARHRVAGTAARPGYGNRRVRTPYKYPLRPHTRTALWRAPALPPEANVPTPSDTYNTATPQRRGAPIQARYVAIPVF
ncbi:hypothetical protein HETIRDRAFT_449098 [Heterobasidion irregulare TC 32-1]|uniref:Uncharacterized protein n=1 Tax=Heterobasidion irregulare (strain TC 32-1) TaxID=747525 RepID=W4KLI7_HETIT|nr:uncharacterized protein HETIRDRAFT_449098 [Heterobasidion irregulare TC 32-1]ETW86220.1 hypothetical protein HETIRDRAFT_449098 [Heterobasidion irregulare TC 32-1]